MRALAGLILSLTLATGLWVALFALLHASRSEPTRRTASAPDLRIPEPLPDVPRPSGRAPGTAVNANSHGEKSSRYSLSGSLAERWRDSELILLPLGELRGAWQQYHERADEDGRFRFADLPAGDYELRLAPRFPFSTWRIRLGSDLRLDLRPPERIPKLACRVKGKASRALAGVDVLLLSQGSVLDRRRTDQSGECVLENVPRVQLDYLVWGSESDEEWSGTVDLSGGQRRIDLVLAEPVRRPVRKPVKK